MDNVIIKINKLASLQKTSFVAIDGMPGSGKTTLSNYITRLNSKVKIIKIDNFYNPSIGNTDFKRLKKEVFESLEAGKQARFMAYDWKQNSFRKVGPINSGGVIIIEGISSMDRRLVNLYDYRIWVDCPFQVSLERVLKRDNKKYEELWTEKWMPEIIDFIKKQKPYEKADLILNYKDIPALFNNKIQ